MIFLLYVLFKENTKTMKIKMILLILLCFLLAVSSFGCSGELLDIYKNSLKDTSDDDSQDERPEKTDKPVTAPATTEPAQTPLPTITQDDGNYDGWTVMLYLNGSNLESDAGEATTNLISLLNVPLPENIHVLIFTGGTLEWQNDIINPQANQIWEVDNGEIVLLDSASAASIGESSTLSGFLKYGQALYPGTRRALMMWNTAPAA